MRHLNPYKQLKFSPKRIYQKGIPSVTIKTNTISDMKENFLSLAEEWGELTGKNFFDTNTGIEADEVLAGLQILENTIFSATPFVERMFRGGEVKAERILEPLASLLGELTEFLIEDINFYKKWGVQQDVLEEAEDPNSAA